MGKQLCHSISERSCRTQPHPPVGIPGSQQLDGHCKQILFLGTWSNEGFLGVAIHSFI